jgi:hypothetical protein
MCFGFGVFDFRTPLAEKTADSFFWGGCMFKNTKSPFWFQEPTPCRKRITNEESFSPLWE